eukprot:s809_g1.t1
MSGFSLKTAGVEEVQLSRQDESVFETRLKSLADEALRTRMESEMQGALVQMEEQVVAFYSCFIAPARLQRVASRLEMGCCPSKGDAWKARLQDCRNRIMQKSWRHSLVNGAPPDVRQLGQLVSDLEQCHGWFDSEGK